MAAGLPCVTTELGTGTSFVVQHGVTGLVVPPMQPAALASALNTLVHDEALRRQLGQQGMQRVKDQFTADRMIDGVETIYQEILNAA
jgi:glycosyltransferase involved in cell wall biosynthesis